MSTAADKLTEFQRAWMDADNNYDADLVAAAGDATSTHDIETKWWTNQANWSRAATAALDQTSPAIDAVLKEAKAANDATDKARAAAATIASVVNAGTKATTALTGLLKAVIS